MEALGFWSMRKSSACSVAHCGLAYEAKRGDSRWRDHSLCCSSKLGQKPTLSSRLLFTYYGGPKTLFKCRTTDRPALFTRSTPLFFDSACSPLFVYPQYNWSSVLETVALCSACYSVYSTADLVLKVCVRVKCACVRLSPWLLFAVRKPSSAA